MVAMNIAVAAGLVLSALALVYLVSRVASRAYFIEKMRYHKRVVTDLS